jgi:hypothetical protein
VVWGSADGMVYCGVVWCVIWCGSGAVWCGEIQRSELWYGVL